MARRLRAGRRTNLLLLALLTVAFGSGVAAFAVGVTAAARWVTVGHAAAGLGLVVLVPWKQVIVRRGLGRPPSGGAESGRNRAAGVTLVLLLALTLVAGLLHTLGGYRGYLGVTPIQVHVAAAVAAVPLVVLHVATHRQRLRRRDLSRRSALRALAIAGGGAAVWGVVEGVAVALRLPGASRRATGSHETGSGDPDAMPVTQWLSDRVPAVDPQRWRLRVVAGGRERVLPYDDMVAGRDTVAAVLDCTGGWFADQTWRGVWLDRLLPADVAGRSVDVVSVTGYRRRFPLSDAGSLLLATRVGGRPLSAGHGSPARLVAPGRRGFWWVKWVVRVEVSDESWWQQPPFPIQ